MIESINSFFTNQKPAYSGYTIPFVRLGSIMLAGGNADSLADVKATFSEKYGPDFTDAGIAAIWENGIREIRPHGIKDLPEDEQLKRTAESREMIEKALRATVTQEP